MIKFSKSHFSILLSLAILVFSIGSFALYAAAPPGGYNPGATLDPDCAPNDTDCLVALPTGGSATATNGLQVIGSDIGLGGSLTQVTVIDQNGNNFSQTNSDIISYLGNDFPTTYRYVNGTFPYFVSGSPEFLQGFTASMDFGAPGATAESFMGIRSDLNDEYFAAPTMINQTGNTLQSVILHKDGPVLRSEDLTTADFSLISMSEGGIEFDASNTISMGSILNFTNYGNTRDDSGSTTPLNFLYTGADGELLSAPLSYLGGGSQWTDSGSNIYFNTGNVGIGTNNPTAPLTVFGDMQLQTGSIPGGGVASIVGDISLFGLEQGMAAFTGVFGGQGGIMSLDYNSGSPQFRTNSVNASNDFSTFLLNPDAIELDTANSNGESINIDQSAVNGYHVIGSNSSIQGTSQLHLWTPGHLSPVDQYFALQANPAYDSTVSVGYEAQEDPSGLKAKMYYATPLTNVSVVEVGPVEVKIATNSFAQESVFDANGFTLAGMTADPVGANGAMYYNSMAGKFRFFQQGEWRDVVFENLEESSVGDIGIAIDNFDVNSNGSAFQVGDGTNVIGWVDMGTGDWANTSDERLKENVRDLSYGLDTVLALDPKEYEYIRNGETAIGFIAQDVLDVLPEVVSGSEETYYGISYASFAPVLVKAIQDLNDKVNAFSIGTSTGAAIGELVVDTLKARRGEFSETLCVGTVCVDEAMLGELLEDYHIDPYVPPQTGQTPDPELPPADTDPALEQPGTDEPPVASPSEEPVEEEVVEETPASSEPVAEPGQAEESPESGQEHSSEQTPAQ